MLQTPVSMKISSVPTMNYVTSKEAVHNQSVYNAFIRSRREMHRCIEQQALAKRHFRLRTIRHHSRKGRCKWRQVVSYIGIVLSYSCVLGELQRSSFMINILSSHTPLLANMYIFALGVQNAIRCQNSP